MSALIHPKTITVDGLSVRYAEGGQDGLEAIHDGYVDMLSANSMDFSDQNKQKLNDAMEDYRDWDKETRPAVAKFARTIAQVFGSR